jgi:N-carbamoylputrescine amidase
MKARCAVVQMQFRRSREDNVRRAADFVRQAGAEGAQIVALSELATSIYPAYVEEPSYRDWAEPIPGPSTEIIAAAARDAGVYVVFPLYERTDEGRLFNTAAFIKPSGEIQGLYRKNSIPDVRLPEMMGMEKFYFDQSDLGYPVFETELGITVGVTICYERHFPEGPRSLALAGADVVFVPTATAAGRDMWEVELRGHAIANLFWVAGVNRWGRDEDGSSAEFYGDSMFIAPSGEVMARAGTEGEAVLHAEIDTDLSTKLREDWGFFRDRRPEIYGAVTR